MNRRFLKIGVLAGALLLPSGCWVEVKENVTDVDAEFQKAWATIQKLEAKNQGIGLEFSREKRKKRKAKKLHLLVYEKDRDELVKMSFPLWVARLAGAETEIMREKDLRFSLDDVRRLGPGLIMEVEDESGHILIWLK